MLNQRTMDAFLLRINKISAHLSSAFTPDGRALLAADERIVRFIDNLDDPMADERLQDATNEQRARAGSNAFRFEAEAHNHLPVGENSDSFDSGPESESHESDQEFIDPNSQISEASEALLPRYSQARANINSAAKSAPLPEIIALKSVKDLPQGYCCRGHLFSKRIVAFKRNSKNSRKNHFSIHCSFCKASSDNCDIFTCSSKDSFACMPCLNSYGTFSAPPSCPADGCSNGLSSRFLPSLTSTCHNGHEIPADTNFWMCNDSNCKTKLCFNCCPATVAAFPQNQPDASLNVSSPSPSSSCSPNVLLANNGPSGAPMRPHYGQ
jgi:hypothetical protein